MLGIGIGVSLPGRPGIASPSVVTPSITSPTSGQIDIGETPTLQSSAFAVANGADTHASSQWQIRKAVDPWTTLAVDSGTDTVNKVSYTVAGGILLANTAYVCRVRHTGTVIGASAWSADIGFTTATAFVTYATWNPADKNADAVLTNGNLTVTAAASDGIVRANISKLADKWQWELKPGGFATGIADGSTPLSGFPGSSASSAGYLSNGSIWSGGSNVASVAPFTASDTITVAVDVTARTVAFYKEGVLQDSRAWPAGMGGQMFPMEAVSFGTATVNFGAIPLSFPVATFNPGLYT